VTADRPHEVVPFRGRRDSGEGLHADTMLPADS
jgi:hypothetical protein